MVASPRRQRSAGHEERHDGSVPALTLAWPCGSGSSFESCTVDGVGRSTVHPLMETCPRARLDATFERRDTVHPAFSIAGWATASAAGRPRLGLLARAAPFASSDGVYDGSARGRGHLRISPLCRRVAGSTLPPRSAVPSPDARARGSAETLVALVARDARAHRPLGPEPKTATSPPSCSRLLDACHLVATRREYTSARRHAGALFGDLEANGPAEAHYSPARRAPGRRASCNRRTGARPSVDLLRLALRVKPLFPHKACPQLF